MTHYVTKKRLKLADGEWLAAGAKLPAMSDREMARLRQRGAVLEPVEPRRRIRITAPMRFNRRHVDPGTELVVDRKLAVLLAQMRRAEIIGPAADDEPLSA